MWSRFYHRGGGLAHAPHACLRFLSWNYRGLGNSDTVKSLIRLVNTHDPNCLLFMKTKCNRGWVEKVGDKLGFNKNFVVDPVGPAGGLAIMWNNEINFDVKWNSDRNVVSSVK